MASQIKCNDDSNSATATALEAATTTKISNNLSTGDGTKEETTSRMQPSTVVKNGDADAMEPKNSDAMGNGTGEKSESSAAVSPGTTSTSTMSNNSPLSISRMKPLEKPKPLKLADQQQHLAQHKHQLLYHPPATAGFANLGGSHMLGSFPHPVYVGSSHLAHQSAGALGHHVQSPLQQIGQHHQNLNHPAGEGTAAVSIDEILETMEHINRSMKSGQLSTTLAGQIFRLYSYLKQFGEMLEQSHKNEMNRVFTSLRQAACRDSGQLGGAPCRLKILELVELRAMGWRPNLAHSQYYLSGGGGSLTNGFGGASAVGKDFNPVSLADAMSGGDMEQLGAVPVSAPPFGTFPMNPFAFNLPPASLAAGVTASVASAADLVSTAAAAATMSPPQGPSYYLIPASHVGHTQAGIAFISPTAAATVLPPPPISPLAAAAAHQQRMHMPVSASLSQPLLSAVGMNPPSTSPTLQANVGSISTAFPKGMATKSSGKYTRPAKIPGKSQYRDEVVIRNADSGKSKRRHRIKVPQGAKERTLTITGPTEESIEQAKALIEETIRRNVSPIRGESDEDVGDLYRRASLITCLEADGETNGEGHDEGSDDSENGKEHGEMAGSDGQKDNEFMLEAGQLGEMLKLQCNDPALLEAAKQALSAYFRGQKPQGHQSLRRTTTDAAARDQNKKERRKSMPTLDNQKLMSLKQHSPPKLQPDQYPEQEELATAESGEVEVEEATGTVESGKSSVGKPHTLTMVIAPPIGKQKASSAARSTPNLAAPGYNKRALGMMKSLDVHGSHGGNLDEDNGVIETKFMADDSGGGTVVVHEMKNRITVRVVYTREFVLQCAASPFAGLTPAGLPWMAMETPDILRPVPGKFDINEYKQTCIELKQLRQ